MVRTPDVGAGEDDVGPPAREDPALDDAGDRLQLGLEPLGVAQVEAGDVEDREAVVGDEAGAGGGAAAERAHALGHQRRRHRQHGERDGRRSAGGARRAETLDQLALVDDADEELGGARHHLLPGERPAGALDQPQLRIHLVGPVDVQRKRRGLVEPHHPDPGRAQRRRGGLGARHGGGHQLRTRRQLAR